MAGVDIVGALLAADAELLALVPEERIKAGALPDNVQLPAILVTCISTTERQPLKRGASTPTFDRVAATVRAASYREQRAVYELVKTICAGKTGDAAGGKNHSVRFAGAGPEIRGPGDSFERTADFRVGYGA